MITADTITDEQIRELMRSIAGYVFPASGMAHTEQSDVWHVCQIALGEVPLEPCLNTDPSHDCVAGQIRGARARCAEILNARKERK